MGTWKAPFLVLATIFYLLALFVARDGCSEDSFLVGGLTSLASLEKLIFKLPEIGSRLPKTKKLN